MNERAFRKPNFFILGAPKCGTTSLASWLSEHPNIFVSPEKEPNYFNTEDKRGIADTLEEYEALFREVRPEHIAIGEATVWYLSSPKAVRRILEYSPDARFIVMVRNPIEMAPALHGQMLVNYVESVQDFHKAWNLQEERRRGNRLPAFLVAQRYLMYGEVCCVGAQLESLFSIIPAHRVLVLTLDDIQSNPRNEYLKVLAFLGVPDDGRVEFPAHNTAVVDRWTALTRLFFSLSQIKTRLGIKHGSGLWALAERISRIKKSRKPLSPELETTLKEYFANDVELLGRLLQRDLQKWLS